MTSPMPFERWTYIEDLRSIVGDLVDAEPCRLDHDGGCQAHDWFGETECPHARAKRFLGLGFLGLEKGDEK